MFILISLFIYAAIGASAGFLAGLFGVGGGLILVPCFYYTLSWLYPAAQDLMQISVGTALGTIIITSTSSARAHHIRGNIRFDIIKKFAPGIVAGALLAAIIADQLHSETLKILFAVIILFLAGFMIFSSRMKIGDHAVPGAPAMSAAGLIIGCISGMMGIGGAALSVPYMNSFHTPMRHAVGTASTLGLFIAIPAVIGFIIMGLNGDHINTIPYAFGYFYLPGWAAVVSCSYFTAKIGAKAAHDLDPAKLKRFFAVLMVIIALGMLSDVML